jgi:hypothetical protein
MGIFDHVAPSERAADLALVVRRIRKRTGLEVVPMLVVEGRTDEPAFGALCRLGDAQVFSAGTRALVEQLLLHLEGEPIPGSDCVFLVDCDGRGKTAHLANRAQLVVTQTCDLESDLVRTGIAVRVASRYVSLEVAHALVARARFGGLRLSIVRRAAHRAGVSMKRGGKQLGLLELGESRLGTWSQVSPTDRQVVEAVAELLGWSAAASEQVHAEVAAVNRDCDASALGKDVLDELFRLLRESGTGDVCGWDAEHFRKVVRTSLEDGDMQHWVVGQRIARWADERGHRLLASVADGTSEVQTAEDEAAAGNSADVNLG